MDDAALRWNTIASSISTLAGLGGAVTTVAIIATVVRRHRPDAYRGLLWWSIGSLVLLGANVIGYPLIAVLFHGSSGEYLKASSVWRVVGSLAHLGLVVVLVRGLVAIAQPPKPFKVESDAPYR